MKWLSEADGHKPAQVPGVYAFYFDGNLSYIGSSNNLARRLKSHGFAKVPEGVLTRWGTFSTLTIKFRPVSRPGDWLRLEYVLIGRLRPPLNGLRADIEAYRKAQPSATVTLGCGSALGRPFP